MGFLSSFVGAVVGVVVAVGSAVGGAVSAAWEGTKRVVARAIGYMADRAEDAVGAFRNTWSDIRPAIERVRSGLQEAARHSRFRWMAGLFGAVEGIVGAVADFGQSTFGRALNEAIDWTIRMAQEFRAWQDGTPFVDIAPGQRQAAARHRRAFHDAWHRAPGQRRSIEVLGVIADYIFATSEIKAILDSDSPANFEHYLRLRATQKLLEEASSEFLNASDWSDFDADDLFILRVAANLIKADPELDEADALRLDELLLARKGKRLASFVFEEVLAVWDKRLRLRTDEYATLQSRTAAATSSRNRLRFSLRIDGSLTAAEQAELGALELDVPRLEAELRTAAQGVRDLQTYLYASAGFLLIFEKTPQELEAEDRGYLIEDGALVGKIVIDAAEKDLPLGSLGAEDRSRLQDFARIFELDYLNRTPPIDL